MKFNYFEYFIQLLFVYTTLMFSMHWGDLDWNGDWIAWRDRSSGGAVTACKAGGEPWNAKYVKLESVDGGGSAFALWRDLLVVAQSDTAQILAVHDLSTDEQKLVLCNEAPINRDAVDKELCEMIELADGAKCVFVILMKSGEARCHVVDLPACKLVQSYRLGMQAILIR